jgi:predicted kinase
MNERTYERLRLLAAVVLDAGYPVIVDAAMLRRGEREALRALAARHGVRGEIVWCEAPPAALRRRIARRDAQGRDASDATLAVLERQQALAEIPGADERVLRFDTAMSLARLDREVAALAAWLRRR